MQINPVFPSASVAFNTQTAGSTATVLPPSQMSSADRAAAVGDAISGIATNGYVEARMGLTKPQTNMLDGPSGFGGFSGVSTVIGMANNALEVNGGWQSTIQGFTNGFSNISWLLHDASPDKC